MSGPALLAGGARCAPPSGLDPSATVCAAAYSHGRIWNPPLRCRGRCSSSTRKAAPYIGRGRAYPARGPDREHPFSVHLRAAHVRPLHARRRGRGCCAESARSGQDRSLHGTRERRIVGRCGVVSVGPRLSVAKPGSEQCLPLRGKQPHERASFAGWRRSLCAAKRS